MAHGRAVIREWPAGERPRERLREVGPGALSVRELLAILVGSGPAGRTAVDVAGSVLLAADGSLRRLAVLTPGELERLPGVGSAVSARLAAALELGRRLAREGPVERPRIGGPRDVYRRCGPSMRDLAREEFRVLLLNSQHDVTRELTITTGVLDGAVIHPREVFKEAITRSAAAVLLVHNHPSGDPTPSAEDRAVTRQLARAGELVGIPVLDHVVIGDGRYVSFVEAGLMEGGGPGSRGTAPGQDGAGDPVPRGADDAVAEGAADSVPHGARDAVSHGGTATRWGEVISRHDLRGLNRVGDEILDAAFRIHRAVGPGLLESVYETILVRDLGRNGLHVERQKPISFDFEGLWFENAFRVDVVVEKAVAVEIKSVSAIHGAHKKQLLTYLRLMDCRLGLLLNFGTPLMKDGVSRVINGY